MYFSAGHNFGVDDGYGGVRLPSSIDLSSFTIWFGNTGGEVRTMSVGREERGLFNLKDFLSKFNSVQGSICYKGEKIIINGQAQHKVSIDEVDEDYCAILLYDNDAVKKLIDLDLKYLECGQGSYLYQNPKEIVSIFGHPQVMNDDDNSDDNLYPLRVSFGIEKERKTKKNFIIYDNDTLKGNSGSPVIGRGADEQGYKVKGIHIKGIEIGKTNGAQGLGNLEKWIYPE